MTYSAHFLSALGAWQRGWLEDATRRLRITDQLMAAIESSPNLPPETKSVREKCYRKRFLVPNNPQNNGDLVPLILRGWIDEGVASWTTEPRFAEDFKDPLRDGTISAVFGHMPKPEEVILNVKALWTEPDFEIAVERYAANGGPNAAALQYFKSRQSEVILNCPLRFDEVETFCGRSSPFEDLCEAAGISSDQTERDEVWRRLVERGEFPGEPRWLRDKEGAARALRRAKDEFIERIRKLESGTKTPN
jgi:hypothetical protein